MTQITYIKSSLNHSSALTAPEVALSQFGLWGSIKRAFKKFAKPLAMVAGIALSIAVPFIAAPVAGVIFSGTALATGAIGGALAGAGMGAVAGALTAYGTGQNVLMGAALGGLGGGIGGGIAGYGQTGGLFGALSPSQAPASGIGALPGGTASIVPTSATVPVPPENTPWNVVTTTPGSAGTVTTGATGGMSDFTKGLLEATLKAAPAAIGTLVSSLAPSDVGAAAAELQAEMARLQQSDVAAYNKAKMLYDQLYARYQQIDPVAAAQLAEADVQAKTAGLISQVSAPRGAASAEYATDAEKRRIAVQGAQEASGAYTDAYYRGEGAKTQALGQLAGLIPRYESSTSGMLSSRLSRAEQERAGLASDVSSFLTPYAMALAPKDVTLTSDEAARLKAENDYLNRKFMDSTFVNAD